MALTKQTELKLRDVRRNLPTTDLRGARDVLKLDDYRIHQLLDEGAIKGVLNIASPSAAKKELRFLFICLEEYAREIEVERSDELIAGMVWGLKRPLVKAHWVYTRLNCHATHFYDLARERVIKLAKGSEQRCGPGGSAVVEWADLLEFVKQRRIS